jgi:hypothetical protein
MGRVDAGVSVTEVVLLGGWLVHNHHQLSAFPQNAAEQKTLHMMPKALYAHAAYLRKLFCNLLLLVILLLPLFCPPDRPDLLSRAGQGSV